MSASPGRILAPFGVVLLLALLATVNLLMFAAAKGLVSDPLDPAALVAALRALWAREHDAVTFLLAIHGMVAVPIAVLVRHLPAARLPAARPAEEEAAPAPGPDPNAVALLLLGILQREGRLVDFLEEDLEPYPDEQVGAAARSIHAECRKALHERMRIERIFAGPEGSEVEVPEDFDRHTVRLTGNVSGRPPFRGVLRHGGWRAVDIQLPQPQPGSDPSILAPAEVEVP